METSAALVAQQNGLKRMGARPPLGEYISEAWARRDFAYAISAFTNEAANSKNALGKWWSILLPTLQAATYGLIFGFILGDRRPDNFLSFMFVGVFLFQFLSGSLSSGAKAISNNAGLVRSLSFPRILLPLSAVIRQFLNLLPQLLVLAVALIILQRTISVAWLAMIPILALMIIFGLGVALFAARLTVHLEDLSKIIPFINRILFYASGIFFSFDKLAADIPWLATVKYLNPVYDFVELARGALVVGYSMTTELWLACAIWAFAVFIPAVIYFWLAEERYGEN